MITLSARKLIQVPYQELMANLEGYFQLQFDDGVIQTQARDVVLNWFFWEFHRRYPELPVIRHFYIRTVIGKGRIKASTHREVMSRLCVACYHLAPSQQTIEDLTALVMEVTNMIHNFIIDHLDRYQSGFDFLDMIEIIDHPDVRDIILSAKPRHQDISRSYEAVKSLLRHPTKLIHNPLVRFYQSDLVREVQLLQILCHRGYVTDIDEENFRYPVMGSYLRGINELYESAVESRGASISHSNAEDPLEASEYFNRVSQMGASTCVELVKADCGSTHTLAWHVTGKDQPGGGIDYLLGVYFFDERLQVFRPIDQQDQWLIGQTIQIRSPVAGCKLAGTGKVCLTCYGDIGRTLPDYTNIGIASTIRLNAPMSQIVISVKHAMASTHENRLEIPEIYRKFIQAEPGGSGYMLNKNLLETCDDLMLFVDTHDAPGLLDILRNDQLSEYSLTRISRLKAIGFMIHRKGVQTEVSIPVRRKSACAYFTEAFIEYLKQDKIQVVENGLLGIDMRAWPNQLPFIQMPNRHESMTDYTREIASLIRGNAVTNKKTDKRPSQLLLELHQLVSDKMGHMNINLSVLGMIVYVNSIVSRDSHDYRLPSAGSSAQLSTIGSLISHRSLGVAMGYQELDVDLMCQRAYFGHNRPGSPFDVFVMPEEVARSRGR